MGCEFELHVKFDLFVISCNTVPDLIVNSLVLFSYLRLVLAELDFGLWMTHLMSIILLTCTVYNILHIQMYIYMILCSVR